MSKKYENFCIYFAYKPPFSWIVCSFNLLEASDYPLGNKTRNKSKTDIDRNDTWIFLKPLWERQEKELVFKLKGYTGEYQKAGIESMWAEMEKIYTIIWLIRKKKSDFFSIWKFVTL